MQIRFIIAYSEDGKSNFLPYTISCTEEEYKSGFYIEKACLFVEKEGYRDYVAYDEYNSPNWFFNVAWNNLNLPNNDESMYDVSEYWY